jgi:hypothetical protein
VNTFTEREFAAFLVGQFKLPLMPLEVLNLSLMLLGCFARREGAQVLTPSLRIGLSGIEAVFSAFQFANHTGRLAAFLPS